jgi:hypothetical protein
LNRLYRALSFDWKKRSSIKKKLSEEHPETNFKSVLKNRFRKTVISSHLCNFNFFFARELLLVNAIMKLVYCDLLSGYVGGMR